jgi:hypothetical protein
MNSRRLQLALLIFSISTYRFVTNASLVRAEVFSLGVYPPLTAIHTISGKNIKAPISLENLSDQPTHLTLSYSEITADEQGIVTLIPTSSRVNTLLSYVSIRDNNVVTQSVELAPKQKKILQLTIAPPSSLPIGDYYFSVIFRQEVEKPKEISVTPETGQATMYTSPGIASHILLSISSKDKEVIKIDDFSVSYFTQQSPVPFTIKVRNIGKQFIRPKATLTIKNIFGKTISKFLLHPPYILAGKSRFLTNEGIGAVALWKDRAFFGPYTAIIEVSTEENKTIVQKSVSFFIIPFRILLTISVLLFILFTIIAQVKKKMK